MAKIFGLISFIVIVLCTEVVFAAGKNTKFLSVMGDITTKELEQMASCMSPKIENYGSCETSQEAKNMCEVIKTSGECLRKYPKYRRMVAQLQGGPEIDFYMDAKYEGEYMGVGFITMTARRMNGTLMKDADDSKYMNYWNQQSSGNQKKSGSAKGKKTTIIIKKGTPLDAKCATLQSKNPYSRFMGVKYKKVRNGKRQCDFDVYACERNMKQAGKFKK